MKRTHAAVLTVAIAAACGGGAWLLRDSLPGPETVAQAKDVGIAWAAGDSPVYDLTYESRIDRAAGDPFLEFSFSGKLTLTTTEVTATGASVHAQFEPEAATVSQGADGQDEGLRRNLSEAFGFSVDAAGRITETRFPEGTTSFVVNAWKTWLSALQFSKGSAEAWTAEESDAVGRYTASYRRDARATPRLAVNKTKSAYSVSDDRGAQLPRVVKSEARYVLSEKRRLVEFDWREETVSELGPAVGELTAHTHVRLALARENASSTARVQALVAALATMDRESAQKLKQSEPTPLPDHLGVAPGTRLPELAARATSAPTSQERLRAVHTLGELMRQKPDQIEAAAERIAQGGQDAEPLMTALGAAGTKRAQQVLTAVMTDEGRDLELRLKAASVFNFVDHPDGSAVTALDDLRDDPDVGGAATLALGSVADNLGSDDPVAAAELTRKIGEYARAAASSDELQQYLTSLGNTGNAEALPVIRENLQHQHVRVRGAAVFALRNIEDAEAEALILQVLLEDASPLVRNEALRALGFRQLTARVSEALAVVVATDEDPGLRHQGILMSARLAKITPALRGALELAVTREGERAANAARNVLAMNAPGAGP